MSKCGSEVKNLHGDKGYAIQGTPRGPSEHVGHKIPQAPLQGVGSLQKKQTREETAGPGDCLAQGTKH